jgi:two-component system sensor histidine kinase KdpD
MPTALDEARRPSPEALLERANKETRARLKVFVGAAPGVGKTYAMLQAAHERRRDGVDVVVGVVEAHGRRETEALLEGFEVLPRRIVEYRGTRLDEMDLDAVLARRPALVLVDELAHTNAPGSRHPKRFSDVEELLDAGIDVYTTVNIQHLESLNDVIAQITGIRVRETLPDSILERADEVKLVDVTPEDLIQRLQDGKVYMPVAAERAIRSYFRPGNLTALRELALRLTAERVDDQMREFMQAHAVPGVWPVTDRIIVGVSGGALSERLVRTARRMAERRRAEWIAVFVETAAFHRQSAVDRESVARALRLAEALGGEAVTIAGERIAEELVRYAERRNATEIVLGKPRRAPWRDVARGSPANGVIRASGNIDVRIVSGEDSPSAGVRRRAVRAWRGGTLRGYLVALALVGASSATAVVLRHWVALDDFALVFLTGILGTAVLAGLGPALLACLLSFLAYDWLFVHPLYTFTVTQPQDVLSLLVFLAVAVLTSNLTSRIKAQAETARRREERTAALYDFGEAIAGAVGIDDLLPTVARHVAEHFDVTAVVLLPDAGCLAQRAAHPAATLEASDVAAATWAWEHNQAAGRGTNTLPGGSWKHVPLHTARGVVGVVSLRSAAGAEAMSLDQRQLLEAMARQAAIAIERTRVDVVLAEKAKTEAVMEAIEDGIIVLDPAGGIVHVNEVACAILQVARDDVLGRRLDELGSRHPHYLRLRAAVREYESQPGRDGDGMELSLFLRGREHYYVLRPTPFRAPDGSDAGLILALQDVTHLRDQERRREALLGTLSHELRTPLTSIAMALELLRKDGIDDEQRRVVETLREDVVQLQDLAQRLLDLSRSRAMTIALERRDVDLAAVATRLLRTFGHQAEEKQVTLAADVPPQGCRVPGDETRITWAVSNLLANALRYTPHGGRIELRLEPREDDVRVSVVDTGPGIPPDQRDRIFERFAQGGDGGEAGAAGLGLAIVRDIVQAHGGRIMLESDVGHGSRFTLELPRR